MGSGSTFVGIVLIFVFGILGIYGLAMWLINGVLPLWGTVYNALWLHAEPAANWLYYTVAQVVLVTILVPLWTWLCAMGVMTGFTLAQDY